MKYKKISIAIPFQQHSYRTAEVLEKHKLLFCYYTTVFYDKKNFLYKILKKTLPHNLNNRMKNRYNSKFALNVSKYYEILGLFFIFIAMIDKKRNFLPQLHQYISKVFSKKIVKDCLKNKIEILIMYDTLAYYAFKDLENNKNIIKILDMASVSAGYIRDVLDREINSDCIFKESLETKLKFYTEELVNKSKYEIEASDYIIVACFFSKELLMNMGVDENRILYLPLGVDTERFSSVSLEKKCKNSKLSFLFVGRIESAKGIFYLFEAFKRLTNLDIELNVVGSIRCDEQELIKYKKNINFLGNKTKEEMPYVYKEADVYILPSLWEGFSLSLFEALSSGLPVIASKASSAPDVIKDYKEGFLIDPGNIEQLIGRIKWFNNNKDKLEVMSKHAKKITKNFSWENYENRLLDILSNKIEVGKTNE